MKTPTWTSALLAAPLTLVLAACGASSDSGGEGSADASVTDTASGGDVSDGPTDTVADTDLSGGEDTASPDLDTFEPLPDVPVTPDIPSGPDIPTGPDVPDTFVGPDVCSPSCVGKFCGDDGCGGSCGSCLADYSCSAAGQCEPIPPSDACVAEPDVAILCTVDVTEATSDCVIGCALQPAGCANCVAAATGLSGACAGCYGAVLQCAVSACALQCFDASSPGCQACLAASCTPALEACAGEYTCPCVPKCDEASCEQDDGCGGTCPACPCVPTCGEASVCGDDDGCGGFCTACPEGLVCDASEGCVEPPPPVGDTCDAPLEILELPFTKSGTTAGFNDDLGLTAEDLACGFDVAKGVGTPELALSFTPKVTGDYSVTLSGEGAVVYVVTDCAALSATCAGGGDGGTGPFSVGLEAGVTYYLVVDAAEDTTFELTLEASCSVLGTCCAGSCGADVATCGCEPGCVDAGTCCTDFCAVCGEDYPEACTVP